MKKEAKKPIDFEAAIKELKDVVDKMEQGNLPLETALKLFEHGVSLTSDCNQILKDAEQKVQILMQDKSGDNLQSFSSERDA